MNIWEQQLNEELNKLGKNPRYIAHWRQGHINGAIPWVLSEREKDIIEWFNEVNDRMCQLVFKEVRE